ncbi:hypothetical protein GCM10010400_02100 [Streptomyces aculeolatus]
MAEWVSPNALRQGTMVRMWHPVPYVDPAADPECTEELRMGEAGG